MEKKYICKILRQIQKVAITFGILISPSCYVANLGYHQLKYTYERQPIDELLASERLDTSTTNKLKQVKSVLKFAENHGFHTEGAYTYYVALNRSALSYIVEAAPEDRLKLKTWWFPIVGRVPYLGFYSLADSLKEAKKLKVEGYDVHLATVGAFSTLGWFSDPIFSTMLNRSPEFIAELLFHELTHRTIWLPGSAEFNEQLADFVASKALHLYLESRGENGLWANVERRNKDRSKFRNWLGELKTILEKLYLSSEESGTSKSVIMREKEKIFEQFLTPPKRPKFDTFDYIGPRENWNNATVMGAMLYHNNEEPFQRAYDCTPYPKLENFFAKLRELGKKMAADPQKALQQVCM